MINEKPDQSYFLHVIMITEAEGFIKDVLVCPKGNELSFYFYCRKQHVNSRVTFTIKDDQQDQDSKSKTIILCTQALKFIKNLKLLK